MRSSPARSALSIALVGLFTLYPLARMFLHAFLDPDGNVSLAALAARVAQQQDLGLRRHRLEHAAARADDGVRGDAARACFVLVVTRTQFRARRLIGVLSVLPMITPPFVIGLALILLFGRSGAVNALARMGLRHPADALDLRIAGRVARADAGADAGRLSRAGGHCRGHQRRRSRKRRKRCARRRCAPSRRSHCR